MAKTPTVLTDFGDAPPIMYEMTNDQYHAASGISRSQLWTLYKTTPAKMKFGKRSESAPMKLGSAAGCAILEPEEFESRYMKGSGHRGNSNAYKDEAAHAEAHGAVLLKPDEYDAAQCIRESAHSSSSLRKLIVGAKIEQAAFVLDEETGVMVKVKPDLYAPEMRIVADIKTAASAAPFEFSRSMGKYGYHFQEAFYWEFFGQCLPVEGFVFIVVETEPPYLVAQYELAPSAHKEGRLLTRQALAAYAACEANQEWPGYPDKVVAIDIPKWDYNFTNPNEE